MAVLVYGSWRLGVLDSASSGEQQPLRVAIVQPSIPQEEKWDRRHFAAGMRRLYSLSSEALEAEPRTRLLIWPETALTVDLEQAGPTLRPVVDLLRGHDARLLLGAPRIVVSPADGSSRVYNSAGLLGPDGRFGSVYDKQVLLPFGEYYPAWVSGVSGLRDMVVSHMGSLQFSPGRASLLLDLEGVPFGVAICYEATYPELVGAMVSRGARFIVNLTNDAWFEESAGAAQHLAMARMRAVEHRVPLLRAANTGISALVLPSGRMGPTLRLGVRGLLAGELRPGPGGATYTSWGDAFAFGCTLLPFMVLLCQWMVRRLGARARSIQE